MEYVTIDPRSGKRLSEPYPLTSPAELNVILDTAAATQREWARVSSDAGQAFCRRAARELGVNADLLASAATLEMGKLRHEAIAEIEKCAALCDYYAEHLPLLQRVRKVEISGTTSYVTHQPLGTILGIMPWNFPYWQAVRFAIPALAAGNVALLKHAPNVPKCAELLVDLLRDCHDLSLISNLRLGNLDTEGLIHDSRVAGVSLTGGTSAGKSVGAAAGAAIKPSVLELGGSDPYLVLWDADLGLAVEACFAARRLNSGQSCISAKRIIVDRTVASEFSELMLAKVRELSFAPVNSEDDAAHHLAPMARADLRDRLHHQVRASIDAGATCMHGAHVPEGAGFYYPATVLGGVVPGMPAFDEELFGPVFVLIEAANTDDAIRLANGTPFGLGAAVFSRDVVGAEHIAATRLRAGACFVNDFVRSDPRMPFGGVGVSGYGRELALEGYRAFCNVKTVYVAHPLRR